MEQVRKHSFGQNGDNFLVGEREKTLINLDIFFKATILEHQHAKQFRWELNITLFLSYLQYCLLFVMTIVMLGVHNKFNFSRSWVSEHWTSPKFKWWIHVILSIVTIFECHLNTGPDYCYGIQFIWLADSWTSDTSSNWVPSVRFPTKRLII